MENFKVVKRVFIIFLFGYSVQLMAQHHGHLSLHERAIADKGKPQLELEYQLLIDVSQLAVELLIMHSHTQSITENKRDWHAFLATELGLLDEATLEYINQVEEIIPISITYDTDVKSEKGPAPEIDRSISPEKLARWTKGSGYTVIRQKLDAGAQTVMAAVVFNVKHVSGQPSHL